MGDLSKAENFINLTESELDKNIYRIMPERFVINLFAERTNVLSQIHNWKDKFENFQLRLGVDFDGAPFEYRFRNDFVGQCWTLQHLSEAMWGIYANDPKVRFLRIRSTPRKVLAALVAAHPAMPQDTCFVGKVQYKREGELKAYAQSGRLIDLSPRRFVSHLLLKRRAFKHESEVRLLYFGEPKDYDAAGLYRYRVDPHALITQIMADPNRDRANWTEDKAALKRATNFTGRILRSKIYDAPEWTGPKFHR